MGVYLTMLYLCLLLTTVSAFTTAETAGNHNMARTFGVLTAEVRDSFLYPLLLNPLQINKLTCGSVLTLYDNSSNDMTVAADICLITLLIGKLMVLLPIILENLNVDLENGVFGAIGSFKEGVESGVDNKLTVLEKPIEALAGFPDKLKAFSDTALDNINSDTAPSYGAPQTGYPAPQAGYSAPQAGYSAPNSFFRKTDYANSFGARVDSENDVDYVDLSQIKEEDLADYYNLPRSFQVAKIETVLHNILKQLEGAITVTSN